VKLKEALEILKSKGKGIVKHGQLGGWSDSSIQYILHSESGELCWTAGGGVGGDAKLDDKELESEGWEYFNARRTY
jgi:hypothetical protein